ncbi:SDR family NAD(P)-dependent oxidoreductase [Mucilaginibacter ginsenosidivorax]|nr:SDR family oxidoreductase [Mucilaginibacter ginsenosidivorax]
MMTFDFTNKRVLITGGSRGIGRACAQLFAAAGAQVAITYLSNQQAADETIALLPGTGHSAWQLQIQDAGAVETFMKAFIAKYNGIDVLVNNAGVFLEHKIMDADYTHWLAMWKQTIDVNLVGAANLCYFAGRQMAEQGGGKIVNISSRGAFRGEPDCPAYGASKAGLNSMSQSLAIALAPKGVSIHVIAPGFTETDMTADILNSPAGQAIKNQSPFGRVANTQEVATLVAIYASPGMEFSSGGIIDINGASYLRS